MPKLITYSYNTHHSNHTQQYFRDAFIVSKLRFEIFAVQMYIIRSNCIAGVTTIQRDSTFTVTKETKRDGERERATRTKKGNNRNDY